MIAWSDLVNALLVVIGVAGILLPMHQANRNQIRKQGKQAKQALRAIVKHEEECNRRWQQYLGMLRYHGHTDKRPEFPETPSR